MLIGAHGVAPSKNSLSRRVRRVLDGALARAPGGWRWSTAAAFFAAGMAVPVAALNFVPTTPTPATGSASFAASHTTGIPAQPYYGAAQADERGLSTAVSNVVATSVAGALSVVHPHEEFEREVEKEVQKALDNAWRGVGPRPGSIGPRGPIGPHGVIGPRHRSAIDRAIDLKAVGMTAEYVASLRAASPQLRALEADDAVDLKAVGVSPAYVRDLAAAGYAHLDADDLMEARALGVDGRYVRGLASAGYPRLSIDQLVELRAMGVTRADIERFRRAAHRRLTVDQLVEMKAVGIDPDDIREAERDDGS